MDAVFPADALPDTQKDYAAVNAAYFVGGTPEPAGDSPVFHVWGKPVFERVLPPDFASPSWAPDRPARTWVSW